MNAILSNRLFMIFLNCRHFKAPVIVRVKLRMHRKFKKYSVNQKKTNMQYGWVYCVRNLCIFLISITMKIIAWMQYVNIHYTNYTIMADVDKMYLHLSPLELCNNLQILTSSSKEHRI